MIKLVRPHSRLFQPVRFVHSARLVNSNYSCKDRSFGSSNKLNRRKKLFGKLKIEDEENGKSKGIKDGKIGSEDELDDSQVYPFSKLTDDHFKKMNGELKNPFCRSLVNGHRPIYIINPNIDEEKGLGSSMGFTEVKGKTPWESQEVELPISIISKLGAFDPLRFNQEFGEESEEIAERESDKIESEAADQILKLLLAASYEGDDVLIARISNPLSKPIQEKVDHNLPHLMDMLEKHGKSDSLVVVMREDEELTDEMLLNPKDDAREMPYKRSTEGGRSRLQRSIIRATSVKRKRRLKMNRHKYKKRRKEQEALRKKLGKS